MLGSLVRCHDVSILIGLLDNAANLMMDLNVDDIQSLVSDYACVQSLALFLLRPLLFVLCAAPHLIIIQTISRSLLSLLLFACFLLLLLLLALAKWGLFLLLVFFLVPEAVFPHQLCSLADDQMKRAFFELGQIG